MSTLCENRYERAARTGLDPHSGVISAYRSCGTKVIPRTCGTASTATVAITTRGTKAAHAAQSVSSTIVRVHSNGVLTRLVAVAVVIVVFSSLKVATNRAGWGPVQRLGIPNASSAWSCPAEGVGGAQGRTSTLAQYRRAGWDSATWCAS